MAFSRWLRATSERYLMIAAQQDIAAKYGVAPPRRAGKGFDVSISLYGPGVILASRHRGYPPVGTEGFPGNLAGNRQIETLLKEGAKVYACRFAMGALYGFREEDLIDGVQAFSPLDVLDSALTAWRAGAFQLNTWTV